MKSLLFIWTPHQDIWNPFTLFIMWYLKIWCRNYRNVFLFFVFGDLPYLLLKKEYSFSALAFDQILHVLSSFFPSESSHYIISLVFRCHPNFHHKLLLSEYENWLLPICYMPICYIVQHCYLTIPTPTIPWNSTILQRFPFAVKFKKFRHTSL